MSSYQDVERWLERIEASTVDRCERAEPALGGAQLAPSSDGARRVFAALLHGDSGYLVAPEASLDWVSWVEDHPPHLSLTSYPTLIVDLIPCTEAAFVSKYGCTPAQFARLLTHPDHRVFVNLRNGLEEYLVEEVRTAMAPVLELCETTMADRFYRLAPIRERGFRALGVDLHALSEQAAFLCSRYEDTMWRSVAGRTDISLRTVSRTRTWMPPAQLVGRLVYYLAARALWPVEATLASLDVWIADGSKPLRFEAAMDYARPFALMSELSSAHHLHTAPLTGALGGNYGWLPHEMDHAARTYRIDPPRGTGPNVGVAEWLLAFLIGDVALDRPMPTAAWRPISDAAWNDYLDRAKEARARGTVGNLARLFEELGRTRPGKVLDGGGDNASTIAAYVEHIERSAVDYAALTRTAMRVAGLLGAGAAAAGTAFVSVPVGLALTALSAAYELSANVPGLREYRENLDRYLNSMSRTYLRRTELRAALSGLV
jgi:hypothetical protein